MAYRAPLAELETHSVTNQATPFEDVNLYETDRALQDALAAFGGSQHEWRLSLFGKRCGAALTARWSRQANENPPQLKSFDRYGHRLDEVEFHPAYHELMSMALAQGISGDAWTQEAGHVLHGAMMILMGQADPGVPARCR